MRHSIGATLWLAASLAIAEGDSSSLDDPTLSTAPPFTATADAAPSLPEKGLLVQGSPPDSIPTTTIQEVDSPQPAAHPEPTASPERPAKPAPERAGTSEPANPPSRGPTEKSPSDGARPPFVPTRPGIEPSRPRRTTDRSLPWGAGLPGLGIPPGQSKPVAPVILHVEPGVTQAVTISGDVLNRIETPFREAMAVDVTGSEIRTHRGSVYLLPAGKPIGLYITDKADPASATVSLTLIPKSGIPGQNILVQFEGVAPTRFGESSDPWSATAPGHMDDLVDLLKDLALGHTPQGYTVTGVEVGVVQIAPTLSATPDLRWSGRDLDVFRYLVENRGSEAVELSEPAFYRRGVRAISFFPLLRLEPGQRTYAFVVAGRVNP